jgi:hypothetical protein
MQKETNADHKHQLPDEAPPFGRSWAMLYAIVLINLVILTTLFYIFTKAFS